MRINQKKHQKLKVDVIGKENSMKRIKNAGKGRITEKIPRKLRNFWVSRLRHSCVYKYCYKSYWYYLLHNNKLNASKKNLYFAARPNPGAGIGHQMANWIAGYWFAKKFEIKFAHIPFSSEKWEKFLGFYQGEKTVSELKKEGYKVVRVQKFDEDNEQEVSRIQSIITAYAGEKVVFLAEQDQFYHDQYGVCKDIQEKFYSAPCRKEDKLIYDNNNFNIAVHIRRGDIVQNLNEQNKNITMRFQGNAYFINALKMAFDYCKDKKDIHIYLFSQGVESEFLEFKKFQNVHFCLDMGAQESFLHMVYADALITSKSSFSYKPALLNRGIKFVPKDFWHGYPQNSDWIQLEEDGTIKNAF